jgi:hypothetical protein
MNFSDLLKLDDLNATEFRLVRHGYKEIKTLKEFREDIHFFNAYQSFQRTGRFGSARYLEKHRG